MPSELSELTKTFNAFMQETTRIFTRLEVNQEHLTKAVQDVSKASSKAIESNGRLESKLIQLEDRALDRLNLVEDSVNETHSKLVVIGDKVQVLELVNANMEGASKASEKLEKKWFNNWQSGVALLSALIALAAFIYSTFFNNVGGT